LLFHLFKAIDCDGIKGILETRTPIFVCQIHDGG
jgi:hypothetical protein